MALNQEQQGRLLRHLNGELSPGETADLNQLLKENAEARSFLRGVAEQAVVVADVERLPHPVSYTHLTLPTIYSV